MISLKRVLTAIIAICSIFYISGVEAQSESITKPQWQGVGYTSMEDYIQKNVKYPDSALSRHLEGKVMISATIDTGGNIGNVTIDENPGYGMGTEAARVVKSMPRFKPATHNDIPVRMRMKFPVNFKLPKDFDVDSVRKLEKMFKDLPDSEAVFPGGWDAMKTYLKTHLNIPKDGHYNGTIYAIVDIEPTGEISDARITRETIPALDAEVIRMLKGMPKWKPAYKNWKPIKTSRDIVVPVGSGDQ